MTSGYKRSLERQQDSLCCCATTTHPDIELNISGCMNSCGHHHVGHIGILGVDIQPPFTPPPYPLTMAIPTTTQPQLWLRCEKKEFEQSAKSLREIIDDVEKEQSKE